MRSLILGAILVAVVAYMNLPQGGQFSTPKMPSIAHAGGGISGHTYTNSFQAMDHNYELGFRYFEIDFSWTTDNQLVCLHDWEGAARKVLKYRGGSALSYEDFTKLVDAQPNFTPCDVSSLNQWLAERADAFIVTDVKEGNLAGLELIMASITDADKRIIPQFYQVDEYQPIREMGFNRSIWTLYRYAGSDGEVAQQVQQMSLFAVTMPEHRVKQGLADSLSAMDIPTYVHTINKRGKAKRYVDRYNVSSIYTDFLTP